MSTPEMPPEEPQPSGSPDLPPPGHEPEPDQLLARGGPLLAAGIVTAFAVGTLAGVVKDLPPGLVTAVTVLIGLRYVVRARP